MSHYHEPHELPDSSITFFFRLTTDRCNTQANNILSHGSAPFGDAIRHIQSRRVSATESQGLS